MRAWISACAPTAASSCLEANANPEHQSSEEDFADSAKAAGVRYPPLLEQIIRLGFNYQAAWRIDEAMRPSMATGHRRLATARARTPPRLNLFWL